MSDKLNLNCWVLGDDPQRVFSVEIKKSKTVAALKEAIKESPSSKGDFNGIDAKYFDLWKVQINLKKDRKLLGTINVEGNLEGSEKLEPEDEVWEVLTEIPKKYLHIIVQCPPTTITRLKHMTSKTISEEEKQLQLDELQKLFFNRLTLTHSSPSQVSELSDLTADTDITPNQPAAGAELFSFDRMHEPLDQSLVTSDILLPSSTANFSAWETFPFNQNLVGLFPQMTSHHGRSTSISTSSAHHTYSEDQSGPSSASATSTVALAAPHARATLSHVEQYQSWKDTPNTCPVNGNLRLFVPQQMYKPQTGSDRRRYIEEVRLSQPIIFEVEHPNEWGIALDDALSSRTRRLLDKDALMFEGCGPSVSIRLEWPGAPWCRQIPTKDFRNPPGPITKAKLAKNIANCVQRFVKDTQGKPINDMDTDALRFRVGTGPNDVKLEDLILVSFHHVSQGSWQPQLRLKRCLP